MRFLISKCVCITVALLFARTASANEFDVTGNTCMADRATIQSDNHNTQFGGDPWIGWNSNRSGTIVCHAQIPVDITGPSHLWIMYNNDTSVSSTDKVKVLYQKMNKSTGAITTIQTADSSSGTNDGNVRTLEVSVSDSYNASSYVYFLRVELTRASSTANGGQRFIAATLW